MTEDNSDQFRDATFRTSTYTNANAACVEVAFSSGSIAVKDTKFVDSPTLIFSHDNWSAFVNGVKNGDFDIEAMRLWSS